MSRAKLVLLTALLCCISVCCLQCTICKGQSNQRPVSAKPLKPQDDFNATMDAYNKADTSEKKVQLWLDFLKRNPNNQYTVGTIDYVVQNLYLDQKKDPEGAVKFALDNLAKVKDEKLKRRGDSTLIRLYGKVGDKGRLRALAAQIEGRRRLTADDHIALAEASLKAKDWDFARKQGELLLAADSANRNRGQANVLLGRAALESDDPKGALDHFGEAAKIARSGYAGLLPWPYEELNLYWAKALLKSGNAQAALDKIAVEATIAGDKGALEVLEQALRSTGSKEELQQYVVRVRARTAKIMPAFSAYDFDKKKRSWDELRGQVTLVAFWFPG